jgi:hypothetical protein
MSKFLTFRRASLLGAAAAIAFSACAFSANIPKAPSSVCLDAPSGPCATTPAAGGAKKWNPGHYLRPSEQSFPSLRAARNKVWDLVRSEPLIKGGLVTVPWGTVEAARGEFNFSEIDADVATMKAMGKKLIIEVWWMNYWSDMPVVPQSKFTSWLPDHVVQAGCVSKITNMAKGYTVQLQRADCMDRLISLYQALAARYDGNDTVEQIIITEPSTPYAEWNPDTFHTQFKRLIPAVAKAWPKTSVVFYMNWYQYHQDLMANTMVPNGVGVGGPDIIPTYRPTQDNGSSVLQGLGGEFGTTDYRGRIPVSYSYEAAIKDGPPLQLIGYAMNNLKATHLVWVVADYLEAGFNYTDGVLPAIKSVGGKTASAYPTDLPH